MEYLEKGREIILRLIQRGPLALFETLFGRQTNILFLGIDNAGKTTLLLRLKTDSLHTVAPTLSVREETLQIGNMNVTISDLGGHATARLGWATYFIQSHGIVFVIDITDEKRYDLVQNTYHELIKTMKERQMRPVPIAVLFNKTDLWKKYYATAYPGQQIPMLDEAYLNFLCQRLGIQTGDGEDGQRVSANFCSVVEDSVADRDKGFMLAFRWLDLMVSESAKEARSREFL